MYVLKKAYARPAGVGNRWAEVSVATLSAMSLLAINQTYRDLRLILTGVTDPAQELMFNYSQDIYEYLPTPQDMLLGDWFVWLGNKALPTVPTKGLSTKFAVVANPFDAGFKVDTTQPGARPNNSAPDSARRDLLITHPTLNQKDVFDNVLVSVNGFLHRTDYNDWGLYVKEGGITNTHSNQNVISMISLASMGGIEIIPITEEMIDGLPDEGPLLNPIYLSTPGVNWEGSSALLSLGGKLLPLGKTFRSIGPGSFELDLLKFPYVQHFMEADKYIDLHTVWDVMPTKKTNRTMMALDGIYGGPALKAFLTLSQSFIIRVKAPGVFVEKHLIETSQNPGVFITQQKPTGILMNQSNRILDYVVVKEFDRYCLHAVNDLHENRQFWDNDWRLAPGVDAKRPTIRPFNPVRAWMTYIGVDSF